MDGGEYIAIFPFFNSIHVVCYFKQLKHFLPPMVHHMFVMTLKVSSTIKYVLRPLQINYKFFQFARSSYYGFKIKKKKLYSLELFFLVFRNFHCFSYIPGIKIYKIKICPLVPKKNKKRKQTLNCCVRISFWGCYPIFCHCKKN